MKRELAPEERLIVAADFKPSVSDSSTRRVGWVRRQVLSLADELHGTGVTLKVNSALRLCGYSLIGEIYSRGLDVFADLKLFDIKETMAIDGLFLSEHRPRIVTVVCAAGTEALKHLKLALPESEVIGVTVPTNFSNTDALSIYDASVKGAAYRLAEIAKDAGLDGVACSSLEVPVLSKLYGTAFSYNCAGIRPEWSNVEGDDQNKARSATPFVAIARGATRLVVGRPITGAANRLAAVEFTLDEIRKGLEELQKVTSPSSITV